MLEIYTAIQEGYYMTYASQQLPFDIVARPEEPTPANLRRSAYEKFGFEVDNLEALFRAWTVGTVEGDKEYLHPLFKAADSLPLGIVLCDVGSLMSLLKNAPNSSIHRGIDEYITSRVSTTSFADNFAALAYYDLLSVDGGYGDDRGALYQVRAMALFVSSGSTEEKRQALEHVYDMNEDPDGTGATIGSLPSRSVKVLLDAVTDIAKSYLQNKEIADPKLIEMSLVIHKAAMKAGLFESPEIPTLTLVVDGPKPV